MDCTGALVAVNGAAGPGPGIAETVPDVAVALTTSVEAGCDALVATPVSVTAVSVFAFSCFLQDAANRLITNSATRGGVVHFFINFKLLGIFDRHSSRDGETRAVCAHEGL